MNNISILPSLKIYAVGFVWWVWFLYQPFDWDKSIIIILLSMVFYILYFKIFMNTENRFVFVCLTAPVFISLSVVIVGAVWYLVAL